MLRKIIRWLLLAWKQDQLLRMRRKKAFFERRNLVTHAEVIDRFIIRKEREIEELENA